MICVCDQLLFVRATMKRYGSGNSLNRLHVFVSKNLYKHELCSAVHIIDFNTQVLPCLHFVWFKLYWQSFLVNCVFNIEKYILSYFNDIIYCYIWHCIVFFAMYNVVCVYNPTVNCLRSRYIITHNKVSDSDDTVCEVCLCVSVVWEKAAIWQQSVEV